MTESTNFPPSPRGLSPSLSATDPRIGTTLLRRYLVREVLGSGGMGTVYLADDTTLRRQVALKLVRPSRSDEPAEQMRLEAEAQRMAQVQSPRVAALHDLVVLPDGQRCVVIELADGISVAELLRRRPVTAAEATHIAIETALALRDIHDQGFLHLDVKPGNILVSQRGKVKLIDFGLSLPLSSSGVADPGRAGGTLTYMPPEQLAGDLLYASSDTYSLGIVYFEMLTGRPPFTSTRYADWLDAHTEGSVVSAAVKHPLLPRGFRRFFRTALAGRTWERFVDANMMLAELRALRENVAVAEKCPA